MSVSSVCKTNIPLTRATHNSAAYDLVTPEFVVLPPSVVTKIDTGVTYTIPDDMYLEIKERSSLGKKGIAVRGGVCDADYKGNICVLLHNLRNVAVEFPKGKAIAQMILRRYETFDNEIVPTEKRIGGFGSTDKSNE